MKRYSLTDKLPDHLPMTPPDEPVEPDLSRAQDCPCGMTWLKVESEPWGIRKGRPRIYCCRCKRRGPAGDDLGSAIDAWNEWISQ